MNPKILLLHPFEPLEGYHYPVPQVALGYLSSALKAAGFCDVTIKDALLHRMPVDDVVKFVKEVKPDIIGLRVWTHLAGTTMQYVERIREAQPNTKFIIGGPHPTVAPDLLSSDFLAVGSGVEFAFAGEAEEGFPLVVRHLCGQSIALEKIPGLVWRDQGKLRVNPLSQVTDLDRFRVDWDALDIPAYHAVGERTTAYDHGRSKNAFVFMTRGCPYPCTYCAAGLTNGRKIRAHSAKRVVDDIEYLYDRYGVRHFNLMDDNFTFYRETVLEFCAEFERRRTRLPGVTFHNPNGVRVDRLDEEVLINMRRCGWKWLHIGIESASRSTLDRMKKRLDIDLAAKNIELIRRHGLKCWGFFMIGFTDETKEDIEETINWAVKSKLNAATFSIFSPIPGTEIYRQMQETGVIPPNYMMSGYMSPKRLVFAKGLGPEDLQGFQRKALVRFYSRPDRALTLLRGMDLGTITNRIGQLFLSSGNAR